MYDMRLKLDSSVSASILICTPSQALCSAERDLWLHLPRVKTQPVPMLCSHAAELQVVVDGAELRTRLIE
jgi:hypothetical protein